MSAERRLHRDKMDGDTLTVGGTEYEDMLRDSVDEGSEDGTLGSLANYTSLEAMVSEVWTLPGAAWTELQLHEVAALLLSALVVVAHGLLGLLPRSATAQISAWASSWASWTSSLSPGWALIGRVLLSALQWALTLLLLCLVARGLFALLRVVLRVVVGVLLTLVLGFARFGLGLHYAFCRLVLGDEVEDGGDKDSEEDMNVPIMESIVSAQLEKEERVQRWIDNLCTERDQVNSESCAEIKQGRKVEAEDSGSDLPSEDSLLCDPSERPLPALPAADMKGLSLEGRRALSLAYELSLAVRQQTSANIHATLASAAGQSSQGGPRREPRRETSDHSDWKLVQRGSKALTEPSAPRKGSAIALGPAPVANRELTAKSLPTVGTVSPVRAQIQDAVDEGSRTPTAGEGTAMNASSSLFNFVRRFSGTRFLLRELANATAEGLRLRPDNGYGRSLLLEPSRPETKVLPECASRQSSIALPHVEMLAANAAVNEVGDVPGDDDIRTLEKPASKEKALSASKRTSAEAGVTVAPAASSATPRVGADGKAKSNVMKVFSKGILSEGTVDISTTSIQTQGASQGAHAYALGGAAGLNAQEAAGLLRAKPCATTATSNTTSTSTSDTHLNTMAGGLRPKDPLDDESAVGSDVPWACSPTTTSRGLTANMSEEGIPRRLSDLETEHKSLFDLKKSLLSSIPEATPPDEDFPHI